MVVDAYKQQRSIRDIMKAFKIPSTATVYKILSEKSENYKIKTEK